MAFNRASVYALLIFLIVSLVEFWPNTKTVFGFVDDHDILLFLGPNHSISAREILPTLFSKTEVGLYGKSPRFRPSFYLLRITEAWAFGADPLKYYIARIIAFALFGWGLFLIMFKEYGAKWAAVFSLTVFSIPYFADIFGRLAAAELHAAMGSILAAYTFQVLYNSISTNGEHNIRYRNLYWAGLSIGCLIAIGSKENMLFIPLIQMALLIKEIKYKKLSIACLLTTSLSIAYALFIASAIFLATKNNPYDYYGQSISIGDRIIAFKFFIFSIPFLFSIALALRNSARNLADKRIGEFQNILFPSSWCAYFREHGGYEFVQSILKNKFILFQLVVLLLIYMQCIFYGETFPRSTTRYDFPGLIFFSLACVLLFIQNEATRETNSVRSKFNLISGNILVSFLVSLNVIAVYWTNQYCTTNQERTRIESSAIKNLSILLKDHNAVPVILFSQPSHIEAVLAVQRFLYFNGYAGSVFLLSENNTNSINNTNPSTLRLNQGLYEWLTTLSINGKTDEPQLPQFMPIAALSAHKQCAVITLRNYHTETESCDRLVSQTRQPSI